MENLSSKIMPPILSNFNATPVLSNFSSVSKMVLIKEHSVEESEVSANEIVE